MKMKTQIKRKAKRTLSLLLTAMLIISTMVVGLSVVNAATTDDAAVKAGESKTFYLFYSDIGTNDDQISSWSEKNKIKMEYVNGKYVAPLDLKYQDNGANQYFAINNSSNKPTSTSQLWTDRSQYNVSKTVNNVSDVERKENGQIYFFRFAYYQLSSVTIEFDGVNNVVITDGGSTPETVTITVPTVDNATVTAASGTATAAAGGSLTVAKDSNFTVTVTPDEDYELAGITYNGNTQNTSPATFTAAVSGDIIVTVNKRETPTEPSTDPPTEPSTEPTTAPTGNVWYLKGSFNNWEETNPLTGSDNSLTTNVYIDSSQVQEFKVWNKTDDKYYGTQEVTEVINKNITNYVVYEAADLKCNVKFKPTESGIYKFTFNPTTLTLNAELVQSGLNAEINVPDSVKAGEVFSVTAKAIPDSTLSAASYKFTIMVDGKVVVSGATSTTEQYTYNKATLSTPSSVSTYVEAYDADGNIIAVSPTVEKSVKVTYEDFSVKIATAKDEVAKDTAVTFTATASPASYVSSYDFYVSESFDFTDTEPVNQALSSYIYTFNKAGTYYIKVVAHNKYAAVVNDASSALDATSNILQVNVFDEVGNHSVTFYFKSPSAFAYTPKMVLDGKTLTVEKDVKLGEIFSGSVTFYWYKATASNLDSSKEHTLSISTRRTNASGSITSKFYGDTYWLAIDNLMSGKNLVNLTPLQEYIRNYYHSPLHTVYAGKADDGTLGFTNINGTRYAMGTYTEGDPSQKNEATLSVKAATAAQKAVSKLDTYSEVQTCLLDVNLDGKVDVLDATMIQKAVVKLI